MQKQFLAWSFRQTKTISLVLRWVGLVVFYWESFQVLVEQPTPSVSGWSSSMSVNWQLGSVRSGEGKAVDGERYVSCEKHVGSSTRDEHWASTVGRVRRQPFASTGHRICSKSQRDVFLFRTVARGGLAVFWDASQTFFFFSLSDVLILLSAKKCGHYLIFVVFFAQPYHRRRCISLFAAGRQ